MDGKAEEYARRAEDAERQAEQAEDPGAKQIYLDIAARWRQMAEQAKRIPRY